jgi:NAD-dependent deacetylase
MSQDRDPELDHDRIERVAELLDGAENALVITGAGVSADSGLPTYRGIGGLYEGALTEEGLAIEDALSGEMMLRRPELIWKYIYEIARSFAHATPNRAHEVIAALEKHIPRTWVLTQNVDAFHRRAGSANVIEVHGDIHRLRCVTCPYRTTVTDFATLAIPPQCPICGDTLRPEVVLFGEMLPMDEVEKLRRELDRGFDVVLSIGTSSLFPYIAEPVFAARERGIPTVEINPGETDVSSSVTHRLKSRAAPTLDAIYRALLRKKERGA